MLRRNSLIVACIAAITLPFLSCSYPGDQAWRDLDWGVWADPYSGYMWQNPSRAEVHTWFEANDYCSNLNLGGYQDWRLPSISELRTLIRGCSETESGGACAVTDECKSLSCLSSCNGCSTGQGPTMGCYWPNGLVGKCARFWSSSSFEEIDDRAWLVYFDRSKLDYYGKIYDVYVRCVR